VKLKHIITKLLVGRKIKSFVNSIFHGLLWKKHKLFNHSQWNFNPFKRIFEDINKIDLQTTSMSFDTLLKLLSIDKETYINALQVFKNK
jgi:hypothetical protein